MLETDDQSIDTWGKVGLFIDGAAMQNAKRAQTERQKELANTRRVESGYQRRKLLPNTGMRDG